MMKKSLSITTFSIALLCMTSCGESDSPAERIALLEHQKALMKIEIESERRRAQLEIEHLKEEQRLASLSEKTRENEAKKRRIQEQNAAHAQQVNAIRGLEVYTRDSLLDEYGNVLVVSNPNAFSVDFNMKCTAVNGFTKTLFVSVGARDSTEVGFLEGWDGNFRSGEIVEFKLGIETVTTWTIR